MLEANTGILGVAFCFSCLIYASWMDIKERSVSNWLWVFMIAVGIPLAAYNLFIHGTSALIQLIFSILSTFALAYLCFRLRLFGGADAKSLVCIALLIPVHPGFNLFYFHFPISSSLILTGTRAIVSYPFAVTTLLNAAIISIAAPVSVFIYNLLKLRTSKSKSLALKELRKNIGYMFIGYKVRVDELADKKHVKLVHSYSYKEGENEVAKRFLFGGVEIDEGEAKRLKNYAADGKIEEEVWVTPDLPFMLFITVGFFVSIFCGNLIALTLPF